jgi:pimeloyl-ACP methyl ester carboxylesterase
MKEVETKAVDVAEINIAEIEATDTAFSVADGVEERWMDFDGANMRYLQAGSGPPLILLHGLLGYSYSWRYALPALAPYRTVYAPDLLGAGFSDRPSGIDHSLHGTAQQVLRFARNLGLTSFDLLGTSRGGAVAAAVAAECLNGGPLRVERLVLVCPVNPYSSHGKWLAPLAGSSFGRVVVRFVLERAPWLYPFWHARMFGDRNKIPPGSLQGYTAPIAKPGLFEHALSIVRTWTPDLRELEALLPKLAATPTLLMWGTKDPAVYFSSMQPLARHFTNVQTVVFPGTGHIPYEECKEEFNRELVKFLAAA